MADLNALADWLEEQAIEWSDTYKANFYPEKADRAEAVARVLRAVAAAPGPLRKLARYFRRLPGGAAWPWRNWIAYFDALADAVGEE